MTPYHGGGRERGKRKGLRIHPKTLLQRDNAEDQLPFTIVQ